MVQFWLKLYYISARGKQWKSCFCHWKSSWYSVHPPGIPGRWTRWTTRWLPSPPLGSTCKTCYSSAGLGSRSNSMESSCHYTLIDFEYRWGLSQVGGCCFLRLYLATAGDAFYFQSFVYGYEQYKTFNLLTSFPLQQLNTILKQQLIHFTTYRGLTFHKIHFLQRQIHFLQACSACRIIGHSSTSTICA